MTPHKRKRLYQLAFALLNRSIKLLKSSCAKHEQSVASNPTRVPE